MLLTYVLIIWYVQAIPEYEMNMYNTDRHQNGYCLLYYVPDFIFKGLFYVLPYKHAHKIIPYCLRPLEDDILLVDDKFSNSNHFNYTFGELRNQNISSLMLLSWSAPIELVEYYQMFLENVSQSSLCEKEMLFYNCTSNWFGPFCRFRFDLTPGQSLDQIIYFYFRNRPFVTTDTKITYYKDHNCMSVSSYLDWRDICNKKMDCLDGSDESNCWQLEINECASNEYRCYNGQCIPEDFAFDDEMNPDCQDGTDEIYHAFQYSFCYNDPTFRCKESTCDP
ncbi:unnamed protein product, partial [Adineta ricciae]